MLLLSLVVLSTTGYGWGKVSQLDSGLRGNIDINNERDSPDGATDILLIGNDSRTDAQGNPLPDEVLRELRASEGGGNLTDTMILLRIPDNGKRARAVSFPRDTMVDMGEFGEHKLNSALNRKRVAKREELEAQGVTDEKKLSSLSEKAGKEFLMETIEDFAGVTIEHYAEVNLLGFYKLTEVVGGVKVCLKNPVDDPYSGADFSAGVHTLSEGDALAFVRQRHGLPRGDLDRIVRQQVFMSGLAKKMLSANMLSNPGKLNDLIKALQDSITLDKNWDVLSFAKQMQGMAAGDIEFYTIPVEMNGPSSGLLADPDEVKRFVDDLLLSQRKREQARQDAEQAEELRADTEVNVYNASGVSGLAGRVLDDLADEGFDSGVAANAESMMSDSVVRYTSGTERAAKLAAADLGDVPVETGEDVAAGTVSVYLGDDYTGPGTRRFTGEGAVRLDGTARAQDSETDPSTDEQPITAGGVRCVN
ncbi:transcriptional attenuator, LytR family [Actinopolyspora lacussalsi subsp. righensis]|uniref:Transcriptional attenuator, LytR family n=1 Tax=Actinopolyspora righensis TaxID=995060 RepID=A0A1I6YF41_9ACTN|nr:LCP family protein [Actinopolyspora righensis]SFT49125.1 transcriptional attenuator, LytR family [Actinopolyspora righensis]